MMYIVIVKVVYVVSPEEDISCEGGGPNSIVCGHPLLKCYSRSRNMPVVEEHRK